MTAGYWIAAGSALGGGLRFAFGEMCRAIHAGIFPWDTLMVNITGAWLIGIIAAAARGERIPAQWRHFLMTGFCGGYTTFSLFSLELLKLGSNNVGLAVLYLLATPLVCLGAVAIGHAQGDRWWFKRGVAAG